MEKNSLIAPFLKWVGGKRQLIPAINQLLPRQYNCYYEAFVGGGAVLFNIQPGKAVINDFNPELINVYKVIKNHPEALIKDLKRHKNESDYFYELRALDRQASFAKLSDIKKASRIIYLNKTCYNGLYRVNSAGEFNAPFGRYKNPNIVNDVTIRAVSEFLNANDITILNGDFEKAVESAQQDDFVYFDPPYVPVSQSANFTGYVKGGFDLAEQERLRNVCHQLNDKGVKFLLSNSSTPVIHELYKDYDIQIVKATRAINSNALKRGAIDEVLIRNYE
ncbi:DNA adenine methylase [Carboxylicivirga mesophila]|uniref:Site-specific DNA-methyltransferase (adenine-specific) n=1 Tax=Carboxylicivirga mesophila TaxID=1166478 RepID=A0ABS5KC42_9BACT|nr:DNA adenine methylase [Carboxylicivirga mesophila]MBS2212609.1 DNA adenine methylase [Carboxylicivirga mesophila]